MKVDALFAKHSSEMIWGKELLQWTNKVDNTNPDLSPLLMNLKSEDIRFIHKKDRWEKMTSRSMDTDFFLVISFDLFEENFACTYALSVKDVKSFKLFSGRYNSTFSEDEIEQFAVRILDNLYKIIESLSG